MFSDDSIYTLLLLCHAELAASVTAGALADVAIVTPQRGHWNGPTATDNNKDWLAKSVSEPVSV